MKLAASACWVSAGSYCFVVFALLFVRAEPAEAWVPFHPFGLSLSKLGRAGWECMLGLRAEAGLSPRQATHFSLLRQRKVSKRKATPSLRPLRCATGQPASGRLRGAPWNSLCAGARRSDNHGESVNEAWALRRPCSPRNRPAAGAASRGLDSQTSTRAIAALGPGCAARGARAREMEPSEAMARVDVRSPGSLLYAPGARRARGGAGAEGHTRFVN